MTAEEIRALFAEINDKLAESGLSGELLICGGALMALSYNRERVTEDIDALYQPKDEIEAIVAQIAENHGLPKDWLNDMVTQSIQLSDFESEVIVEMSHLVVRAVILEVLLTMKLMACRDKDENDIRLLVSRMGNFDFDEVMDLVRKYVPSNRLMYAPHFLTALFSGINDKDLARMHYRQFHKDEDLIDALSEFSADYTFPKCFPLHEVLTMPCTGELMENAKCYVQYLIDEGMS